MDLDLPTAELAKRLREGDPQAAELLYGRYAQRLVRLAEDHLSRKLAGRLAGEDVVQSVFRTFFRRNTAGEFCIDSSAQLWRLLVQITVRKARARGRQHTAGNRDVRAEAAAGDALLFDAVAQEPGPAEAAAFVDQIETLLRGLSPVHAQVLEMRLQGIAVSEVASELNVSRQTVYRILNLLKQRLLEEDETAAG